MKTYFEDESIVEQDIALIQKGSFRTNGFSLIIEHKIDGPLGPQTIISQIEVILTREELKAALEELEQDWEAVESMGLANAT